MATRALTVTITGDPSSFKRAVRSMDDDIKKSESRLKGWGKAGAAALGGIGVAATAGAAVGLKKVADAAIEAEKSQARMVTQLRASDVSYRRHAEEIDRVIQKHSALSGLDDEDLQDAFTNIVRITGDVDKGLRLTGLAADFARAKHMDVAKAGELVAKVAGGNTGILSRYGIQIEKGATATEALGILQQKFAGQAEAYGKTTAGSLDRASVASENLQEVVGEKLTPLLAKAATAFVNLIDKSGSLAGPIRTATGAVRDAYDSVVRAVRRFAERNRESIREVIEAFQRVGRFARTVFEDVLIPVVKRVLPIMRDFAQGVIRHVGNMIQLVTALINGDWSKAWEEVKDIVRNAVRTVGRIWGRIGGMLLDVIEEIPGLIKDATLAVGKAIGNGILDGLKATLTGKGGGILDTITNAIPGLPVAKNIGKLVGDGVGKQVSPSMGVPGLGGGGGLDGADPDLGPFAAVGARFGLRVSSGIRPGSITSSGNQSYHATGDAVDLSGPAGGMLSTFNFLRRNFGSRLRELIYTPGGVGIKDGRPHTYTGAVAADHYDHVHVAYTGPFGDGLGSFASTAYGPPWNAMNGTGVTATGVDLRPAKKAYGVAVDPSVIPLGTKLKINPNPFGYGGLFTAFDTGGAIKGDRIDFYDWRGRKAQMAWGRRTVRVSTASGSSGGAPGASGGGGGAAGNRARGDFLDARRSGRRAAAGAVGEAREAAFEPGAGYELGVARAGLAMARAERDDSLTGYIGALEAERAVKLRRLKRIKKMLAKGRFGKKRRAALVEEQANLVSDLADIGASLKEARADQAGGATTITQAEELDAGVPSASDTGSAETAVDPIPGQLLVVMQEIAANQRRLLAMGAQGEVIKASVAAMVNGWIGGNTAMAYQTVGVDGFTARY